MSEEDGGIKSIHPGGAYTPQPSAASRDRDADGRAVVHPGKRKSRKQKRPRPAREDRDSAEDTEKDHEVDILAEAFRIETWMRNESARFSALTEFF